MTKHIINTSKLVLSLGLLFVTTASSIVQARPADISANTATVPINQTTGFAVYFKYGFNDSTIGNINNVVVSTSITNGTTSGIAPTIELVPTGAKDIFNGDPGVDTTTPPAGPTQCNAAFENTTPGYDIPSAFLTATNLTSYGIQTAKNTAQSSGQLRQGRTGCIKLTFRVNPDTAVIGDTALITFDWDAGRATDITEDQRPARQLVPLVIGAAVTTPASSLPFVSSLSSVSSVIPPTVVPSSPRSVVATSVVASSAITTSRTGGGVDTIIGIAVLSLIAGAMLVIKGVSSSKTKIN